MRRRIKISIFPEKEAGFRIIGLYN